MIKTLNPYNSTSTAKTAEIMSRYRPIAPRPETSPTSPTGESPALSQKIRDSPYLRNLWPQLQARPTRTRKRGRAAISPPIFKRQRTPSTTTATTHVFSLSPACHATSPKNMTLDGFPHPLSKLKLPNQLDNTGMVTLPLLSYPSPVPMVARQAVVANQPAELDLLKPCGGEVKLIELNLNSNTVAEIPEEKDLLKQLQGTSPPPTPTTPNVIAPQPIRPVGSSISVGCISTDPSLTPAAAQAAPKKPEDVEEEVESEALPAIISDSHNKVRMANAAYKEMVGQPECAWLDSMVASPCKRISGEVTLQLSDASVPTSSNAFSCWVRIEWGTEMDKHAINAFCDVIKLACETKDYLFTWRFHTHSREASQSGSSV